MKEVEWLQNPKQSMIKPGHNAWSMKTPCSNCPWRKSSPPGEFPASRYRDLQETCKQGLGQPLFACHHSKDESPLVCVGYLLVEGDVNFAVRMALWMEKFKMTDLYCEGELYKGYEEMAQANGVNIKKIKR